MAEADGLLADVLYRIILIGNCSVGKTTLALRIKHGEFVNTEGKTRGVVNGVQHMTKVGKEHIKVQLDEPSGMERFKSMDPAFFRRVDAIILVYSLDATYTFQNLFNYVDEAREHMRSTGITWALFGNKCDLDVEIQDICDQVQTLREKIKEGDAGEDLNMHYAVSAKTGRHVVQALNQVVKAVHRRKLGLPQESVTITLREDDEAETGSKCC